MRSVRGAAIIAAALLVCTHVAAFAQTPNADARRWGLRFSAAPQLRMADFLEVMTGPETDLNFPLFKAELQGVVRLGRAFAFQMATGLNMPTVNVRVAGVYYFGAE